MTRKFLTPIVLPADPAAALEASTKQYVDAKIQEGTTIGGSQPNGSFFYDTDAVPDWSGNLAQPEAVLYRTTNLAVGTANTVIAWDASWESEPTRIGHNASNEIVINEPGTYLLEAVICTSSGAAYPVGDYVQSLIEWNTGGGWGILAEGLAHRSGVWSTQTLLTTATAGGATTTANPAKVRMTAARTGSIATDFNGVASGYRTYFRVVKISGARGAQGPPGGALGVLARAANVDVTTSAGVWVQIPGVLTVLTVSGRLYRMRVRSRALSQGTNWNYTVNGKTGTGAPTVNGVVFLDWYANSNSGASYASINAEDFFVGDGVTNTFTAWIKGSNTTSAYACGFYIEDVGIA